MRLVSHFRRRTMPLGYRHVYGHMCGSLSMEFLMGDRFLCSSQSAFIELSFFFLFKWKRIYEPILFLVPARLKLTLKRSTKLDSKNPINNPTTSPLAIKYCRFNNIFQIKICSHTMCVCFFPTPFCHHPLLFLDNFSHRTKYDDRFRVIE